MSNYKLIQKPKTVAKCIVHTTFAYSMHYKGVFSHISPADCICTVKYSITDHSWFSRCASLLSDGKIDGILVFLSGRKWTSLFEGGLVIMSLMRTWNLFDHVSVSKVKERHLYMY